jgi:hypothetical protein
MGENLCHLYIRQGIDNQNIQGAQNNDTMKKWANELNRDFSKEKVQMAKKHKKKFSTSLAIKEIQIKTTLRLYNEDSKMVARGRKHKACLL